MLPSMFPKSLLLIALATSPLYAQTPSSTSTQASPAEAASAAASDRKIPAGSKIFIEPMEGGFDTYLSAALLKKDTPVKIVDSADKAEFIVSGKSYVQKASLAKTIFISGAPQAGASITIKNAKSGDLAWAYSVDKFNAARASQSTAEACAKHLKEFIDKGK